MAAGDKFVVIVPQLSAGERMWFLTQPPDSEVLFQLPVLQAFKSRTAEVSDLSEKFQLHQLTLIPEVLLPAIRLSHC